MTDKTLLDGTNCCQVLNKLIEYQKTAAFRAGLRRRAVRYSMVAAGSLINHTVGSA